MTVSIPPFFAPHRLCQAAALVAAIGLGLLVPLYGDFKLLYVGIVAIGLVGLGCFLVLPNRRLWLVCAWVFVLPLSLEKVFSIFTAASPGSTSIFTSGYPDFKISPLVVSGADLVLYLLIATMLLEGTLFERKVFYSSPAFMPYALLVGWVCVMFMVNSPTGEGLIQVLHWVKMLLFLVAFSSAIRTREELLAVLVTVAVAILIQSSILGASYGLKKHIGFSPKAAETALISVPSGDEPSITRATGTLGHPNQQAMYHALFTIPLVALFMVRNWIWRIFAALVLLASICAVIVTVSRTSWISCALGGIIIVGIAWRHGRITRAGWLSLGLGALLGVILLGSFSSLIITRLTKADEGASASRIHLALLALEHVSHHPIIGVGPGNYINAKLKNSEGIRWVFSVWLPRGSVTKAHFIGDLELGALEVDHRWFHSSLPAHNKYLLVAAELGFVGLALFLWFQWRVFRAALCGLQTKDPLLWWVGVALIGAFGATLNEFTFELFYDDKTVLMPMFINALMICFSRVTTTNTGGSPA